MRRGSGSDGPAPARLVALFFAALVLFNFPMLAIFDRDSMIFGLPLLPVALFISWGVLIVLLAWVSESRRPPPPPPKDEGA